MRIVNGPLLKKKHDEAIESDPATLAAGVWTGKHGEAEDQAEGNARALLISRQRGPVSRIVLAAPRSAASANAPG
jgi:hypothetical protein